MTQTTKYRASSQDVLGVFLFLITLLIWFFVTYDYFQQYIGLQNTKNELQTAQTVKKATKAELTALQERLKDEAFKKQVARYAGAYREDELLANIRSIVGTSAELKDISMSRWSQDSSGLSRANMNVSFHVNSVVDLRQLINNLLTSEGENRRILLKSFTMPEGSGPFDLSLALEVYYLDAK